nr:FH1/FH2 domain-containing protein 3 isoform X7 [Bactrocera oleae]
MIVKMDPDELITLRVQYLVDTEPLNCTAMYPIPTRAPTYGFAATMPLATQLSTILRLLGAPHRIDDAAIQVYKDGDYGAYLDLESSLAEQAEEIEGLNSSRKNSLVVRTQLSVRVHAIIEKLLSSEGSELRRALFSLKQVFQEDKDLVHAFVALGGLNCLVRVGNGADQNYQNYILRALGQVMLYVDGMNGVMKHEPTMQWLYSLIASNYRSVVKTALKLLLVFVEYAETNCYVLVNAIHAVDKTQGTLPWSNLMRLLKDYDNADAELVIYATSLINKTLAGLNDQDSFYDESDLLEQQGMESVIQRYMSKPGTDLDLLDQLQLYEAVLKFEDGEAEGIRLPENSLRKTQRHRQSTDTAERRKSRRHSTGTSPHVSRVIASPKRMTPTHGVLDEDSSGSTNSAEYAANGVFNGEKARDAVGVTPGLRRRRERAERHKSFLKEQQEAVANGIFAALERREEIGQIVTAIPATVKMGDSPPESLNLTNEASISINQNKNHNNNSNNIHGNHTINIASSNTTANATNNNINLINTNSTTNMSDISATTNNNNSNNNLCNINNNTNNSNSLLSPTRHLLGSNTISIINNNINANPLHSNNNNNNNNNSKLHTAPEFLTKKNLLMERNATVINGIMKNIQRGGDQLDNNHNNNMAYKKFENDANRLNSYYNQLSTPKNQNQLQQQQQQQQQLQLNQQQPAVTPTLQHQNSIQSPTIQTAHNVLAAVLSPKKSLNGFDFTQSTPKTPPNTYEYNLKHNMTPLTSPIHTLTEEPTTMECHYAVPISGQTPMNTPSTPSRTISSLSTPQTPLSTDFTTETPSSPINAPHTKFNARAAPPPPPPPPPPPDLLGHYFMMPTPPPPPPPQYGLQCPADGSLEMNAVDMDSLNMGDVLAITESDNEDRKLLQQLKRDHTVKDLTQKLSNMPMSPTHEEKLQNRIVGDMSGLISKAKEGLAKSKSKGEMSRSSSLDQDAKKVEPKKSENELHWEELVRNMTRPLNLCDLDFTDLNSEDEKDGLAPRGLGAGIPPPPPPFGGGIPPPMMPPAHIVCPPPMNSLGSMAPPPMFSYSGYGSMTNSANSSMNGSMNGDMSNTNTIRKNKKTVKLFWKEVREDMIPVVIGKTIWDELPPSNVDTQKLEHLFESRAKDLMTKKQQELNKSKEIIVLDHKRSNAINIAMTKLPPPRAIKAAILKMDATVVTREGIDKLLNMLPTDEERGKIQEAQIANPELPLGSAEQFLLTLASISELGARLKLWAFRLDFDNSEKEIAEPLMDLKQGIEILRNNRTFKCILSTLLSVGIFLNGAPVKGFQIEYLSKVPEVKDTVHKHSLLHHLCHMVMESSPDTTDLYSEIGPITRSSKADFSDLAHNLSQLETECKASWDRLKLIAKHDCPPQLKQKLVDFLADCAERIIILQIVHRRVINRYRKFLLWLGAPQHTISESKPNEFCRILSEFALEYRTTRERVQQQLEKKANHRERNKTRGKLIIDMAKFKTKEDRADAELKELLGSASADTPDANGTLTWRRRRAEQLRSPITRQSEENFTDGDDEILESLVKTATKAPGTRTTPRERKRTRHADRKSLRRTLKNGLTEEEKQHVAALIKTY